MDLHTWKVPKTVKELDKIVLDIFNSIYIFESWEWNKMHASFSHIFAWGYSAWQYSYTRADIIKDDVFSEFKKKWLFDKETADRFYNTILSQWSRKSGIELFRDFMGRDIRLDAFLENQGL